MKENLWGTVYKPRLRLILDKKLPDDFCLPLLVMENSKFIRKVGSKLTSEMQSALSNIEGKAKGFGVPVSSTVLHFLLPKEFPIIDVRTREMLYFTANMKFIHANDPMEYELFRSAMLTIRDTTGCDLHTIDRALFHFHDTELQDAVKETYKIYSTKYNPGLSQEEIGNGPNIGTDPDFRRLLIDIVKWEAAGTHGPGEKKNEDCMQPMAGEEQIPFETVVTCGEIIAPTPGETYKTGEAIGLERLEIVIGTAAIETLWLPYKQGAIKLKIGPHVYDAQLHYNAKTQSSWIGAPLKDEGKDVKLAKALYDTGFNKNEEIRLKFNGDIVHVLQTLPHKH